MDKSPATSPKGWVTYASGCFNKAKDGESHSKVFAKLDFSNKRWLAGHI